MWLKKGSLSFRNLKSKLRASRRSQAVIFALVFALVGVAGVLLTKAATPTAQFEAEQGILSGNAATMADATASSGNAVKFGTPVPPGTCALPKRTITASDVSNLVNSGYPAGTQVFVPDGPDPWGGCFPGPSNTGIPVGTTLTNYTGVCTITTANTVIDSRNVNCSLTIRAANVQIRKSKITGGNIFVESGSLLIEDTEVNLGNVINDEGLKGNNFSVLRMNMYGGKRQIWCNNTCTIQDSYLHDQLSDPTGATHESAVRVEEFTTLRHNTLLCNAPDFPPDAGCSANQTGYPDFAPVHDNTLDRNLYMATTGGYCSYGGSSNGKPFSNNALNGVNVKSTDNVFARGTRGNDRTTVALTDKRRYTCGGFGATSSYGSSKPGFVFTGNMWDDGLLFANDTTYPYSFTD